MSFVPVVTPPPSQPVSPRTRELASLLQRVLEEYRKTHPATTVAEMRAAVRLALRAAAPSSAAGRVLAFSLALGVVALTGFFVAVMSRRGGGIPQEGSWALGLSVIVLFLVLMVLVKVAKRGGG